ncbi:(Fe-S)-binding protein [Chloroflexota bacterium]
MLPRTNCKLCGYMTCYAFLWSHIRRLKWRT